MNEMVVLSVVVLLVLGGCGAGAAQPDGPVAAPSAQDPAPDRVAGLPAGWELMPAGATVTASQTPGDVIVRANGELPASNYEAKLFTSPLRIWPPQYLLARRKTGDVGAAVMTPFEVSASFKAQEVVKTVTVRDAGGAHQVAVDQARD